MNMKTLKNKFDDFVIKAYVKYTVFMWQLEDEFKLIIDELKGYLKR